MMGYPQVVPLSRGKVSGIDEESAMAKVRSKSREHLFGFVISRSEAALFRFKRWFGSFRLRQRSGRGPGAYCWRVSAPFQGPMLRRKMASRSPDSVWTPSH